MKDEFQVLVTLMQKHPELQVKFIAHSGNFSEEYTNMVFDIKEIYIDTYIYYDNCYYFLSDDKEELLEKIEYDIKDCEVMTVNEIFENMIREKCIVVFID